MGEINKKMWLSKKEKAERFNSRFARTDNGWDITSKNADRDDDPTNVSGVSKLTAAGCYQRFNIPREEMYMTRAETRRANFEYPNQAERQERRLLGRVAELIRQGKRPDPNMSLEEWVEKEQRREEDEDIG